MVCVPLGISAQDVGVEKPLRLLASLPDGDMRRPRSRTNRLIRVQTGPTECRVNCSPFHPLPEPSNLCPGSALFWPSALVVPTMSQIPCMQVRQAKAHVATTERIQHPACALHRRHACCRVLDIWQAGQLQRQPPALAGAYLPAANHAARITPIRDSLAIPRPFLDAIAGVVTIVSGSLHGTNGRHSSILDGRIFCRHRAHDQELKFCTLLVLSHVTLTMHF